MARQLRIGFEGALYHITSRGNLREAVFFEDSDKERFLDIIARTKERYGYLLYAYALMDNHYHLFIETPKANISQIMQNINTSYTVYINKKYRRSGHLFQGRFKGIIVDKDEYLVVLSRYIHLNPIRAGIVRKPEDYEWTSYRVYIGKASQGTALVDTADTLSCFSKDRGKAAQAYREFVEADIEGQENPFKKVEAGLILGGSGFKERITELLKRIKEDDEIPQLRKLSMKVPVERIINICCGYYGKGQEELIRSGKGKRERQIAIYLSKTLSGEGNREIGRRFGIKGPAVSGVIKTIEGEMKAGSGLKSEMEQIRRQIINE